MSSVTPVGKGFTVSSGQLICCRLYVCAEELLPVHLAVIAGGKKVQAHHPKSFNSEGRKRGIPELGFNMGSDILPCRLS